MEECPNCGDRILDPDLPCPTCGKIPNELPVVKIKKKIKSTYWKLEAFSGYLITLVVLGLVVLAVHLRPTPEDRAREKVRIAELESQMEEAPLTRLVENLDRGNRTVIQVSLNRIARMAIEGYENAGKEFRKTLEHKNPDVRVTALALAGWVLNREELVSMVSRRMLEDKSYHVRQTALRILANIRDKNVIPVLIRGLRFKYPTRYQIKEILVRLTGQEIEDKYELWKDWWERNKDTFEFK